MQRREFLKITAAGAIAIGTRPTFAQAKAPHEAFDNYFLTILNGFLRSAQATSADFVACDFPQGRKLRGCMTPSGKTYTSVARMLPAMAEWIVSRGAPVTFEGKPLDLRDVMASFYRNAFDPKHPDFW